MVKIKRFKNTEIVILLTVFTFLALVFAVNLSASLRKGRDATRKNDLSAIQKALDSYSAKYGIFPLSINGQIAGCMGPETYLDPKSNRYINMVACPWGEPGFETLKTMPRDPLASKGRNYFYFSEDGERYSIYVALEGKDEPEYNPETEKFNLQCGNVLCNYGREY